MDDEGAEAHRRADGKTKGQQQAPRRLRAREFGSLLPQRVTAPAATAGTPRRPQDPLGTPAHRKRPLLGRAQLTTCVRTLVSATPSGSCLCQRLLPLLESLLILRISSVLLRVWREICSKNGRQWIILPRHCLLCNAFSQVATAESKPMRKKADESRSGVRSYDPEAVQQRRRRARIDALACPVFKQRLLLWGL